MQESHSRFAQHEPKKNLDFFESGFYGWIRNVCTLIIPLNEEKVNRSVRKQAFICLFVTRHVRTVGSILVRGATELKIM